MNLHQDSEKIIVKELIKITVTELMPMSMVPTEEDSEMLVKLKGSHKLGFAVVFQGQLIDQFHDFIDPDDIEGWLPIPIYKPEE